MKRFAPNYYKDFHCIADKCRHSCCIGWEIDIDEASLHRYQTLTHPYQSTLLSRVAITEEGACFRLGEKERCPFLQENGLCEMILTLGEDSLCDICREHPRFYNFFSDREEVGIGLCCEEAARLILSQTEPTALLLLDDDGEDECLYDDEEALLALRKELFALLQDRTHSLAERMEMMIKQYNLRPIRSEDLSQWKAVFASLEQMDPAWQGYLDALDLPASQDDHTNDTVYEKLLLYFLYRHLPRILDEDNTAAVLRFALLSCQVIRTISQNTNFPVEEIARLYSCEIEYSEENTKALLKML